MRKLMHVAGVVLLLIGCVAVPQSASEYTFAPFDGFEDGALWHAGDIDTQFTRQDFAVYEDSTRAREGSKSLAFSVRVNWAGRPGEKYAKGWPAAHREFTPPLDWSGYDALSFWLYTDTSTVLPADRVLRCAAMHENFSAQEWYAIPDITPGVWQQIIMPLPTGVDLTRITAFHFYVAEAWYNDGDEVTFYIDDLQVGRRNWPSLRDEAVVSRTSARGRRITVTAHIDGPTENASLHVTIPRNNSVPLCREFPVSGNSVVSSFSAMSLASGGHVATLELFDPDGDLADSARCYFRIMEPGRRTYLSLISFYNPVLADATAEKLAVLNDSAYAAVAIPFTNSYDTDAVPDYAELQPQLQVVRDALTIDPWPWVVTNRFIASPPEGGHAVAHARNLEYFTRIPVLDLDNETGARADMLKMWRNAVRAARDWGAPGIVIDQEAYNNYRTYDSEYIARERGESVAAVIDKCEQLGADLAQIIEEEYPECIVWTLFSRLDRSKTIAGYDGPVHPMPGHMNYGFLRYAKEHNIPTRLLCGGEVSVGYYNPDPEALRRNIARRDRNLAWALEEFPEHFFLAGTISPYHDYSATTGWIRDRAGDDPALKTIDDFEPMFRTLFDAYDYVWIYASSAGKTLPYDAGNNAVYSAVYTRALNAAAER